MLKRKTEISPYVLELFETLKPQEREQLYRLQKCEHIKEDLISYADTTSCDGMFSDGDYQVMAERYVFDGRYDCNLSYWQNIDNLLDEYQIERFGYEYKCENCICLCEKNGQWFCDEANEFCEKLESCPEGEF